MSAEPNASAVRVDKWLWAVRLFKTRSQAAQACRRSQVRVEGKPVKAGRLVRVGDELQVEKGGVTRSLRVRRMLQSRVGAALVEDYVEDLTPPEEWERGQSIRAQTRANRVYQGEEGGRPSKRDRRQMEAFEQESFSGE